MTASFKRQKGKFLHHTACPLDGCGSSDAMAVYEQADGTTDGTCWSCGRYTDNPYGITMPQPMGNTQGGMIRKSTYVAEHVAAPQTSSTPVAAGVSLEDGFSHPIREIESRGISHSTAEHFGVRVGVSSTDGETPIYTIFPRYADGDQTGWKQVTTDKKIVNTGGGNADLFGLHLCKESGKRIWITEGEYDAMSVYQALKEKSTVDWEPPVVSLPDGAASAATSISRNLEKLNNFDEIILVFDNDPAGKEAVKTVCKMLAGKVSYVTLPLKDANDMVKAGRQTDLKWQCLSHAKKYQPDGVLNAKDLWDRYKDHSVVPSIPYPPSMPLLNEKTYGVREGSIITVTAGSGMGKTQFLRELMYHYATTTDHKIAGMFLEEDVGDTLSGLLSLDLNKRITLPDVAVDEAEEAESYKKVFGSGRISLYDYFGGMDDDSLLSKLKYFAVTGHKFIFLDHLSLVVSEYAAEGGERERIDTLMTKLAKFVKEFNLVLFLVVHLRKTDSSKSKSFETGGRPTLDDLRGSGSLKQLSWDVIGLCRNQQHPDPRTANTTEVSVLKCRYTGRTGVADYLEFDSVTGRMMATPRPHNFFDSDRNSGKAWDSKHTQEY